MKSKRIIEIELLRMLLMLMVLGLHANFLALGTPTADSITNHPFIELNRIFFQSICIVAVNSFVMISGYFGIRASARGFAKFLWQVVYIVGLSYIIEYIFFGVQFSEKDVLRCFGLMGGGGWFVASYIGLYIISPVLNAFIKSATTPKLAVTTITFFFLK